MSPKSQLRSMSSVGAVLAMSGLCAGAVAPAGVHAQAPTTVPEIEVRSNVAVPMRDGVRLAADIYLPDQPGPFPVLLTRTPYNKNRGARAARRYAEQGYAVVVMDSRGIYGSGGDWRPYVDEALDGYDTQQWIGAQDWCDGNIGMYGTSYPGFTQLLPAPYRSPYVKALVPVAAQSDNYGSIWSTNGLYHLALGVSWGTRQEAVATGRPVPDPNWMEVMTYLPIGSIPDRVGVYSEFVGNTIRHDAYDDFWRQMSIRDQYAEMDVPAFHVTGWYDDLVSETVLNFTRMRELSRSAESRGWQKLLIGPWGHGVRPSRLYGDMDFGEEVDIDFRALEMEWFDYHLKGTQNGLDQQAPIRIFVMGDNVWRDEYEWPLARAVPTTLFLHSDGFANTRFGDGELSSEFPADEPPDQYSYDPRSPVPTYGGHGCCGAGLTPDGPLDQQSTQQRQDVLVYTSDPLVEDTEVTGAPRVQLVFSTDVTDTDFFVTLSDVHPDGRAILITEGAVRARFRDSVEKPTLLTPGGVYEVEIPMWETSNVFKEGHRIRLHVTSSNFPRFNRNLNSGRPMAEETESDIRVAAQTVYHDRTHASALVLPVIR